MLSTEGPPSRRLGLAPNMLAEELPCEALIRILIMSSEDLSRLPNPSTILFKSPIGSLRLMGRVREG